MIAQKINPTREPSIMQAKKKKRISEGYILREDVFYKESHGE